MNKIKALALRTTSIPRQAETETGAGLSLSGEALAQLRGFYVEEFDKETTLNDDQIAALAESKGDAELSQEEWAQAMREVEDDIAPTDGEAKDESPEATAKTVQITSKIHAEAVRIGNLLASDEEIRKLVNEQVEEDEKRSTRPLILMAAFERKLKAEGVDIGGLPIVGSEMDPNKPSNLPPDNYTYKLKGETVRGSFYRDLALTVPVIKEADDKAQYYAKRQKDSEGTAIENNRLRKKWEGRRDSGVKAVKTAFRILQRLAVLNSECGTIEVRHDYNMVLDQSTGKKTKVMLTSNKPLLVKSTDPQAGGEDFQHYSVSSVLGAKVDKIKALGGGWEAWEQAMKRGKKDGDELPATKMETFGTFAAHMVNFMEGEGTETAYRKLLDKPEADATLLTMKNLRDMLDRWLDPYETVKKQGQVPRLTALAKKAEEAEAAAKKTAA